MYTNLMVGQKLCEFKIRNQFVMCENRGTWIKIVINLIFYIDEVTSIENSKHTK